MDYILRDMTDKEGGFFSAEDADSQEPGNPLEHGEGAFYTWKKDEIDAILEPEAAEIFSYQYGVKNGGNALEDPQQEFTNKNIFYLKHPSSDTAKKFNKTEKEIDSLLEEARKKLMETRAGRPRPHLDDKVITSWNGLMISAFAKGYQVLRDKNTWMVPQELLNSSCLPCIYLKAEHYCADIEKEMPGSAGSLMIMPFWSRVL